MARTFDTGPLREPVGAVEVRRFRHQLAESGALGEADRVPVRRFVTWFGAAVLLPILAGQVATAGFGAPLGVAVAVGGAALLLVVAVGIVLLRDGGAIGLAPWRELLRCERFAAANQLEYAPRSQPADFPGIIFKAGLGRDTTHRIASPSGLYFDCGTHSYLTGAGEDQQLHTWRYLAFSLPGVLPHLLLNSRIDETEPGDLGEFGAADRIQTLDGVMDESFTLYCRPQHRADAFYVFTPDVMALLIDHASDLDVEVAADWLFFYSRFRLQVSDPETWARVAVLADKIVPLISARARSYRYRELR
ncbi:hypothetical protein [Microlunatus sp. GCM10028923]|uniref:hypothetical protein n=1 Tax=Microlunatus sp. GCM10028923 TaxID=3273400 RepID=UPI00362240E6